MFTDPGERKIRDVKLIFRGFQHIRLGLQMLLQSGPKSSGWLYHRISTLPFSHIELPQKVQPIQLVPQTHHNFHLMLIFLGQFPRILMFIFWICPPVSVLHVVFVWFPRLSSSHPWFIIPHTPLPPPPPPPLAVQVERLFCAFSFSLLLPATTSVQYKINHLGKFMLLHMI